MAALFNAVCFIWLLALALVQSQAPVASGVQDGSSQVTGEPEGSPMGLENITSQNVPANSTGYLTTPLPNAVNITSTPSPTGSGGIDASDDGVADNLADYVMKKVGQLIGGNDDSGTGTTAAPVHSETEADLRNCSKPATLDRFVTGGTVPDDVQDFLKHDLSVEGLMAALLKKDVIEALQTKCQPGKWCLDVSYHQDIINGKTTFYVDSPFCSDAMWSSIQNMLDLRFSCNEMRLSFLVNSVLLLCDLQTIGTLSPECYARTVEALYVTYADLTQPNGTKQEQLEKTDCNDFRVQMTKTYLCADDVCNFDQNILLTKFEMWVGLVQNAAQVASLCNITDDCPTKKKEEGTTPIYQDFDVSTISPEVYDEELKEMEEEIEEALKIAEQESEEVDGIAVVGNGDQDEGINSNANMESDEDSAMLFGLITMTTVVTLGLLSIAFVAYRRYKCARMASYRRGYSQLSEEESRMLKNEYN